MPYATNDELPAAVRSHLPGAAQDIYRDAFNHAWLTYAGRLGHEEIAHRVAWAAVNRRYEKSSDGDWHEKRGHEPAFSM